MFDGKLRITPTTLKDFEDLGENAEGVKPDGIHFMKFSHLRTFRNERNEILCILCLYDCTRGRYMLATFLTQQGVKQLRLVIRGFRRYDKAISYRRIESYVNAKLDKCSRFVEHLGFECEGLMRKYVDGEDYYLFSKVR